MVWEASQKGVPFLGVPGNSLNICKDLLGHPGRKRSSFTDACGIPFDVKRYDLYLMAIYFGRMLVFLFQTAPRSTCADSFASWPF